MSNNNIWIVGIGPGSKQYLTQAAIDRIKEADILVGSQKALDMFAELNKQTFTFVSDIKSLIDYLKSNYQIKRIAVLVTGDPGLYSLANSIKKHFEPQNLSFEPGISSVQLFFARLGFSYEGVYIASTHGRSLDELMVKVKKHKKLCILTDQNNSAKKIAQALIAEQIQSKAWIGQNVSLPTELVQNNTLEDLSKDGSYNNALLYLEIQENK